MQFRSKACIACGDPKPIGDYYGHAQMADGHLNKCKDCCRKHAAERRNNKLEIVKEYDRNRPNQKQRNANNAAYAKTPAGIIAHTKAKKDWQLRNTIKRKAHIAVGNALRDGLMKKPANCSLCLVLAKVEGHHDDYARPLDVRWLCVLCHKRVHKEEREGRKSIVLPL